MESDLNCYLDSDFIETITDRDKTSYLKSMLNDPGEIESFVNELEEENSVLVLIFESAINSDSFEFNDTPKLKYKGEFESTLD